MDQWPNETMNQSMPPVFTRLAGKIPIRTHDHVAMLCRRRSEALPMAPFVKEGLERGDFCHYLAPLKFHAELVVELRELEINPEPFLESGRLRLRKGAAQPGVLGNQTRRIFEDAERAGAPGVRWLEEGSWPEQAGFPMSKFFDFHAVLNYQVKHFPSVALCRYSVENAEPRHLFSAIATHRHLLVNDTLIRDNPFYIPAEKFIPLTPEERESDLMRVFRDVGFNVEKLLEALEGYGRLEPVKM